ncbi:hypothetical protein F4677DRAFT_458887 [Hypoxylon crocopeplum]|nr:hypothetical protein F4677DRAFT_458887 [Hypoxylon crocopeplum]
MPGNAKVEPPRRDQAYWDRTYGPRSSDSSGSKSGHTTKVRSDPWQSVSALQLGLQPRSFEELHAERLYLLQSLQQHDQRAVELFKRVPVVEEQIHCAENSDERWRAKKQRAWLRHRIVDTVEEEKGILARLSELHVEIQCRERWCQVDKERELRNLGQHQQQTPGYLPPPTPPPITPLYPQANPHIPVFGSYYPSFYGVPEGMQYESSNPIPGVYPGYNLAYYAQEYGSHNGESQEIFREGIFEMDGKPTEKASDDTVNTGLKPPEQNPELKSKRGMSMPELGHTWDGEDI